jgi:hypothetical protein
VNPHFALSKFDEALYKATDRPNATHGVFADVSEGIFFYQTINIVIPILFIFNLFLLNRLSIKIIYYVCTRQYELN